MCWSGWRDERTGREDGRGHCHGDQPCVGGGAALEEMKFPCEGGKWADRDQCWLEVARSLEDQA